MPRPVAGAWFRVWAGLVGWPTAGREVTGVVAARGRRLGPAGQTGEKIPVRLRYRPLRRARRVPQRRLLVLGRHDGTGRLRAVGRTVPCAPISCGIAEHLTPADSGPVDGRHVRLGVGEPRRPGCDAGAPGVGGGGERDDGDLGSSVNPNSTTHPAPTARRV